MLEIFISDRKWRILRLGVITRVIQTCSDTDTVSCGSGFLVFSYLLIKKVSIGVNKNLDTLNCYRTRKLVASRSLSFFG